MLNKGIYPPIKRVVIIAIQSIINTVMIAVFKYFMCF